MASIMLVIFVALLFAPAFAHAEGLNIEVGQQLVPNPGPYLLVRYNWQLADFRALDYQIWVLPEAGFMAGGSSGGYGRVQVLLDTPEVTLGADGRAGSGDDYARVFVRFDL